MCKGDTTSTATALKPEQLPSQPKEGDEPLVSAAPPPPQGSNNKDFQWVGSDEPHRSRRKEILAKYPQIKELFGPDIRLFYVMSLLIVTQLSMAVYASTDRSPFLSTNTAAWLFLAWSLGGTITHWLLLGNHELSHNLAFQKPIYNEMLGIVANFAHGLPSAIMFKRYHLEHHYFQGHDTVDMDIPSQWEGNFFNTWYKKILWVLLQPAFYALRPVILNPKTLEVKEVVNFIIVLSFDALFAYTFGIKALLFNVASTLLGMGLHPVAGHFIAEHYTFTDDGQETFSYYGPLNLVAFNVGYHNEHHDFPRVSGFRLPEVRKIAPEYYNNLHSYDSWPLVIYNYIARADISPYSRVKRPNKKYSKTE